jgi:hypothetical protein
MERVVLSGRIAVLDMPAWEGSRGERYGFFGGSSSFDEASKCKIESWKVPVPTNESALSG